MGPDDWRLVNDNDVEIDLHEKDGKVVGKTLISKSKLPMMMDKRVHLTKAGYAALSVDGKTLQLAHFVDGKPPKGLVKDHKNQIKLDNRDENLHNVTPGFNIHNRSKSANKTSNYHGVTFVAKSETWQADIQLNAERYSRRFETEKEAARWYDEVAVWLHGPSARTNGFLSQEEISERKQPELVQPRKARTLPQNVYHSRGGYIVQFESPFYAKRFANLEEAAHDAERERERVRQLKYIERMSQPITKNENGVAFIVLNSTLSEDKQMQVLIDEQIWHTLMEWRFSCQPNPETYPYGRVKRQIVRLHVYCWQLYHPNITIPNGSIIAHVRKDRLDCRSENLELRGYADNIRKGLKRKRGASQYVGVTKINDHRWQASLRVKSKVACFGSYKTEYHAHLVREAVEAHLTEMERKGVTDRETLITAMKERAASMKLTIE